MHYAAIVKTADGDLEREVEVIEVSPGHYRLTMDGRVLDVDARFVGTSTVSLVHDHASYNVEFEKNPKGGENVLVRGHLVSVEVLDLRRMRLRKVQGVHGGPEGPAEIASPMPGKIVAVLVSEGQAVEPGQGLIVVEAMKMENELRAPRAGTVKNLKAQSGAAVESGAVLCTVE